MSWADNHILEPDIIVACGATAEFDYGSGYGYRCTICNAVIGSIGMPRNCYQQMKDAETKAEVWEILNKNA